MRVYAIYFSPTGGTKKIIDILAETIHVDARIDLSEREDDYEVYLFGKDDACLIGVPSFGGRVPAIALERLKRMKASGTLAIIVAVFGNRAYDDTLLELKNEVSAIGFEVGAAIAAVAEHSIMRQFGKGRPDTSDRDELLRYAGEIKELIARGNSARKILLPGNRPYQEWSNVPLKPKAGKLCTLCGLCALKCPVGAIPIEKPNSLDKSRCISCMRCIAICPEQARKLNKAVLFVASMTMKKAFKKRKTNELYLGTNT